MLKNKRPTLRLDRIRVEAEEPGSTGRRLAPLHLTTSSLCTARSRDFCVLGAGYTKNLRSDCEKEIDLSKVAQWVRISRPTVAC